MCGAPACRELSQVFVGKWSYLTVSWVFLSINMLLVTAAVFTAFQPPRECVGAATHEAWCSRSLTRAVGLCAPRFSTEQLLHRAKLFQIRNARDGSTGSSTRGLTLTASRLSLQLDDPTRLRIMCVSYGSSVVTLLVYVCGCCTAGHFGVRLDVVDAASLGVAARVTV